MNTQHARHRWRHCLSLASAGAALALVFALYLQPDLMVDLTTRLWTCF